MSAGTYYPRESSIIVLQPGSYSTKAGIADYQSLPTINCPTSTSLTLSDGKKTLLSPIKDGVVVDWNALERLWKEIIVGKLNVERAKNDSSILVTIPSRWSRVDVERLIQLLFESFNFPAVQIIEESLASLYGHGIQSGSGVVLDIGHETTVVTPIFDNSIIKWSEKVISVGGADVDTYLHHILSKDPAFSDKSLLTPEFIRALKESDILKFNSGRTDPVMFTYQGRKIPIGPSADSAFDVLFDPTLVGKDSLGVHEVLHLAISSFSDPEKRFSLWENIILTGGSSMKKGLREAIGSHLSAFLAHSETSNELQPKEIGWARLPDHYSSYKEHSNYAGFLGASIAAKVIFTGGQGYITKPDYNASGPSVVFQKST